MSLIPSWIKWCLAWCFYLSATAILIIGFGPLQRLAAVRDLESRGVLVNGQVESTYVGQGLADTLVSTSIPSRGVKVFGLSHVMPELARRLNRGDRVEVLALPDHPEVSTLGLLSAKKDAWNEIKVAGWIALGFSVLFVVAILLAMRPRYNLDSSEFQSPGHARFSVLMVLVMVLAGIAMLVWVAIPESLRAWHLLQNPVPVTAEVGGYYSDSDSNEKRVSYSYVVDHVTYQGDSSTGDGETNQGPFTVFYSRFEPSYSNHDPIAKHLNARFGILFCLVWEGIMISVLLTILRQWRSGSVLFKSR